MTEFTAADAQNIYQATLDCSSAKYAEEYNIIIEAIKEAAVEGRWLQLYRAVSAPVKMKLEKNGFVVNSFYDQRDGASTTIGWYNAAK